MTHHLICAFVMLATAYIIFDWQRTWYHNRVPTLAYREEIYQARAVRVLAWLLALWHGALGLLWLWAAIFGDP